METSKKAPGTIDDISSAQKATLDRLRTDPDLVQHFALAPEMKTAWNLLRFCRARQFNYGKTKTMLKNYFKFRERVDFQRAQARDFSDFALIQNNSCRGCFGTDYAGRPVLVAKPSLSRQDQFIGKFDDQAIEDYFVQLFERSLHIQMPILSAMQNKRVDEVVFVIDLKDARLSLIPDAKTKAFSDIAKKIAQEYYPELLGKAFIVNAPVIFKGIWTVIKLFLDQKTIDKVHIDSGPALKELAKYMNVDQLPIVVGGKAADIFDDLNGPWKSEVLSSYQRRSFYLADRSIEYQYYYTAEERAQVERSEVKLRGEWESKQC